MEACRWKVCPEITLLHTSPAWPSTSVIWIRAVFVRPLRADTLTDSLHKQAAPCSARVNEPWQKTPWHQLQMLLVQAFFCVSHACLEGPVLLPVGQTHSLVDVIPKMNYDTPEYIIDSITPKLNINQQGCKPCSNQFSFFHGEHLACDKILVYRSCMQNRQKIMCQICRTYKTLLPSSLTKLPNFSVSSRWMRLSLFGFCFGGLRQCGA